MRGDVKAADRLDGSPGFAFSAVTWMERVQGVRNGAELNALRLAQRYWQGEILHLTPGISARASYLMEEHALAHGLLLADALIAATALETGLTLMTGNERHYRFIPHLGMEVFRPG